MVQCARIRWDVAVTAAVAALSLYGLGDAMRESDQASLLDGALRLARGESSILGAYSYNYDKQFVSYWLLAAALKGAALGGMDLGFRNTVFAGNVVAWLVFWAGMLCLVARRGSGRTAPALLLAGTLLSPVVLLNASLLCPNVISAGLFAVLAAQGAGGGKPAGRAEAALAAALTFLAVGARADAVLCLPFLCWLTARRPVLRALVCSRRHWAMLAGAVAALGIGHLISTSPNVYSHPPILNPKVIAAYLACGFGGGFAMFLVMGGVLGAGIRRAGSPGRKRFFAAGLVFALLPLAYYGLQLYTPRHFLTTAWLVVIFATSTRGAALLRVHVHAGGRVQAALWVLVVVGAVMPLFVGARLPAVTRPEPVVAGATRYPTADGHYPMGAVLDFLGKQRRAAAEPIDHNQAIWSALATVEFETVDGIVPLYGTSLRPYFELAATLRGVRARSYPVEEFSRFGFLYGDERVLRRSIKTAWENEERVGAAVETLRAWRKTVVSDPALPQAILRVEAGGGASDVEVEKRLALAEVFAGNEFEVLGEVAASGEYRIDARGRTVVFFSDGPFEVLVAEGGGEEREFKLEAEPLDYNLPGGEVRRFFYAALDKEQSLRAQRAMVFKDGGVPVHAARAVLPGYMSVGSL